MTNDLVNQAHEAVSQAYLRPGRPRGGAGGQTVEATMRCTFHEISAYDLDVITEALGALQADLAAQSWQPIETAPEGEPHLRAMWVFDAHTRMAKYFCVDAGYIDDDGVFVNMDGDDDFGWSADDYEWWAPMSMPLPAPPEAD